MSDSIALERVLKSRATRRSALALAVAGALLVSGVPFGSAALAAPGDPIPDFAPVKEMYDLGFLVDGGTVYFAATGQGAGAELWRSDGTDEGTQLVSDAVAGPGGSYPQQLVKLGDKIVFTSTGGGMRSTDISDGTSVELPIDGAHIQVGGKELDPSESRIRLGDGVIFGARNQTVGIEGASQLWRTDGTAEGTSLILEVDYNDPEWFRAVEGGAVFSTHFDLWFSDGSGVAPTKVSPAELDLFDILGAAGDRVIFVASDFESLDEKELWATDGTVSGTVSLGRVVSTVNERAEWGNRFFYVASGESDIWVTDGTAEGTFRVEESPVPCDVSDWGICQNGVGLFAADDGVYFADYEDLALWRGSPMTADAGLFKTTGEVDGAVAVASRAVTARVLGVPVLGGALVHIPGEEVDYAQVDGGELWFVPSSDGDEPVLLLDVPDPILAFQHLGTANGLAYFHAHDWDLESPFSQLWVSDGTVSGTKQIVPVEPGGSDPEPEPVTAIAFSVPEVDGVLVVGETLSAVVPELAPMNAALSYQWLRNGTAISKAKASSYTLAAADRGKQISVKVTAKSPGLKSLSKTSAKTAKIGYGVLEAATVVTITGDAMVGQKLTAVAPGFSVPKVTLKYQWLRDGKKISKATKASYALTKSDLGKQISVSVTASKTGYTKVVLSADAPAIEKGDLSVGQAPTVKGTAKVGKTLTASSKGWSTTKVSLRYAWYADGVLVQFSSSSKYKLTWEDRGAVITVKVRGTKEGYVPVELVDAPASIGTAPVQ